MRFKFVCLAILLLKISAAAQSAPPDSLSQAMLAEVRQLRLDLQSTAATIQRIQIAVHRIQTESNLLDRATQRLEQARASCTETDRERKMFTAQIEQIDARRRSSPSSSDQTAAQEQISQFKSALEELASQEQQCQAERVDAEAQFRTEQAKMNDLENQLEKLDRALSAYASR
jgi:chromosome segregation ATPase